MRPLYIPEGSAFWPTGWLVWLTCALGVLDLGLIAFLFHAILARHA